MRCSSSSASRSQAIGQRLGPRLHERAVHQVEGLDGDVRRLAIAGDQARLGEVEQVQDVGQPVAEDRQVDRAVPRPVEVGGQAVVQADQRDRPVADLFAHERADAAAQASSSPETTSMASRIASASSRRLAARQRSRFSGSARNASFVIGGSLPIRARKDDLADELLHRPAVGHEAHRQ